MGSPLNILKTIVNALYDDQESGIIDLLPPITAASGAWTPTTVTAGTAFANGTTAVIDDGTGVTEDMWATGVYILNSATATTDVIMDIGTGASGSEKWLKTVNYKAPAGTAAAQAVFCPFAKPMFIPKGTRVASRARGSAATAFDIGLQIKTGLNNK